MQETNNITNVLPVIKKVKESPKIPLSSFLLSFTILQDIGLGFKSGLYTQWHPAGEN